MTDIEPLATTDYDAPLWLRALSYPASVDRDLIDAVFVSTGVIRGGLTVAPRAAGGTCRSTSPPAWSWSPGRTWPGRGSTWAANSTPSTWRSTPPPPPA